MGAYSGRPRVDLFVRHWGLDAQAQQALMRLDTQTQHRVMSDFAPTDVSRGASAAFMGFVRSVAMTAERRHSGPSAPLEASVRTGNPAIDAFIQQWELDSKAVDALVSLDPNMQARVMDGFSPKD